MSEMQKIKINEDTYIQMTSEDFYSNSNILNIFNEDNKTCTKCRLFKFESGIYMAIPEALVKREVKPLIVKKKTASKKEK